MLYCARPVGTAMCPNRPWSIDFNTGSRQSQTGPRGGFPGQSNALQYSFGPSSTCCQDVSPGPALQGPPPQPLPVLACLDMTMEGHHCTICEYGASLKRNVTTYVASAHKHIRERDRPTHVKPAILQTLYQDPFVKSVRVGAAVRLVPNDCHSNTPTSKSLGETTSVEQLTPLVERFFVNEGVLAPNVPRYKTGILHVALSRLSSKQVSRIERVIQSKHG